MPSATEEAADLHRAVIDRVARRLIPFAFVCYVVAYIDRVNIGFAATALQRDLGLSATAYGIGAGLFFLGYCTFEIPSNLILARVGARRWIARILIGWGLVSMGMMFVTDTTSFYIARMLLGIAEAGFFPGMVLYLTLWIPAADRARTGALFMMAAPIAVIVGAPVSEALLQLHGWGGLRGWQWLFVVEGLPAVVLGVLALRVLTDTPEQADWLPPDQRAWLVATLRREQAARVAHHEGSLLRTLFAPRVWQLTTVYFLNTDRHVRDFPVAAEDSPRRLRRQRLRPQRDDDGAVRGGVDRDGADRPAFGSHGRAQVARGKLRPGCRDRSRAGGRLRSQRGPARAQLRALADWSTIGRQCVLGDSANFSWRHGRCSRDWSHQRDRQSWRRTRSDDHRLAARCDRVVRNIALSCSRACSVLEAILAASLKLPHHQHP